MSKSKAAKISKQNKIKRSTKDHVIDVILYIVYGLFALICAFPFYYLFINTISNNELSAAGQILLLPKGVHLENYRQILKIEGMASAAITSVARTVIGTALMVGATSWMGYALSKAEFWHKKFWYRFIIATMYFGAGVVPTYMNYKMFGMLDSFWIYIIPGMVGAYNMILVKTYIESISPSLEESAYLDGAGYFTRFTRVVFPLCKPIVSTITIFGAVGQWNSYMDTIIYMNGKNWQTLQSLLQRYLSQATAMASQLQSMTGGSSDAAFEMTPVSIRYTITFVTLLPILLVYPYFQKFFVKGIMIGAVKG